jgi:single-strand DNA-binding protein
MPRPDGTFETDLIPVVAWQRAAEYLLQNVKAGDVMLAEGRIQVRTEELTGGKRNWITEVVADQVTKLDASGMVRSVGQAGASTPSSENNMEAHAVVDDIPF